MPEACWLLIAPAASAITCHALAQSVVLRQLCGTWNARLITSPRLQYYYTRRHLTTHITSVQGTECAPTASLTCRPRPPLPPETPRPNDTDTTTTKLHTTNMGSATIAEEYRSLSRQPPTDPDIQATLSDYLTYTEHFPSHLTRALSLIEQQTIKAERKIASIHRDTTAYATLPTLPEDARPNPVDLRRNISYALEEAETACRMRVEEATRLEQMARREAARLDIVVEKLKAQPLPPSRDPTPASDEQPALTSPNLKRESRLSVRGDEIKVADKTNKRL